MEEALRHHDMDEAKRKHKEIEDYYAEGYLRTWCGTVRESWMRFLHETAKRINSEMSNIENEKSFKEVIDIGCGPSPANIISISGMTNVRVVMSDLLSSNRQSIENFLKEEDTNGNYGDDHSADLMKAFEFVAKLEQGENVGYKDIREILSRTKESVEAIVELDISKEIRGDLLGRFDVVIASLVFDVVCMDKEQFRKVLGNAVKLLKSDGVILIQGSFDESLYTVGAKWFPVLNISRDDLYGVIEDCDLKICDLKSEKRHSEHYFVALTFQSNKG